MDDQKLMLLKKFIANECTHQELQQVELLLKQGVPEAAWLRMMNEQGIAKQTVLPQEHINALYSKIQSKIDQSKPRAKQVHLNVRWAIGMAASFVLITLASVTLYFNGKQGTPALERVVTKNHERRQLTTPDGSQLWLNNQSSIEYAEQFSGSERAVKLIGEAFFEVTKNASKPFVISAQQARIRVLGTSFNVKSYLNEDDLIITLATGKVQVDVEGQREFLSPGQQLIYHKSQKKIKLIEVDATLASAWKEGWLLFNSTTLDELSKTLARTYDMKIIIESEVLKQRRVTLKVKDESITNLLDVLSYTVGCDYSINKDQVTIKPKQ